MPSTIPYDNSLILGEIINEKKLKTLEKIASLQIEIDDAQDKLNLNITLKKSLELTAQELIGMKVDTSKLNEAIQAIDKNISNCAQTYANTCVTNQEKILQEKLNAEKGKSGLITYTEESPLDYSRTKLMPLQSWACDSLKLDAQYFANDESGQGLDDLTNFVKEANGNLGEERSSKMAKEAQTQVMSQMARHDIIGTLVITAFCTYNTISIIEPCIIDASKAIKAWNYLYPDDLIDEAALNKGIHKTTDNENKLTIISGASYGSSFVGMAHIVRKNITKDKNQNVPILKELIGQKLLIAEESGQVNSSISDSEDIKNIINTQNVLCHLTLVTMGVIPSLIPDKSSDIIKETIKYKSEDIGNQMKEIENLVDSAGPKKETKIANRFLSIKHTMVENTLRSLVEIEKNSSRVMGINSLLDAFENYSKFNSSNSTDKLPKGVPINYYLKHITKSEIIKLWLEKQRQETFEKFQKKHEETKKTISDSKNEPKIEINDSIAKTQLNGQTTSKILK